MVAEGRILHNHTGRVERAVIVNSPDESLKIATKLPTRESAICQGETNMTNKMTFRELLNQSFSGKYLYRVHFLGSGFESIKAIWIEAESDEECWYKAEQWYENTQDFFYIEMEYTEKIPLLKD